MEYYLHIDRRLSDSVLISGLHTWAEVTDYLAEKLDANALKVLVTKFSTDGKLLAKGAVTMGNLYKVIQSKTDKVLKNV